LIEAAKGMRVASSPGPGRADRAAGEVVGE
jgi:hypothetical protein